MYDRFGDAVIGVVLAILLRAGHLGKRQHHLEEVIDY